jgi:hypothetical protein
MLLVNSTTDSLTLVTGSAGTIQWKADYVDNNAGTITPGHTANGPAISTAATTTIVAAPGAGIQRNVKRIIINNTHATVANLIRVSHTDGTNAIDLYDVTLAAGESVCMSEGEWVYYDINGVRKLAQGVAGPITATTLTASAAVTLSPANAAVTISPTGTGTVAISPVGALTINPTAASTANNISVGATTRSTGAFSLIGAGQASSAATFLIHAAGTATVAPTQFTSGTNLTTAAAGAVEYDGVAMYMTPVAAEGRAIVPVIQQFKLTANGTAFNTISNFFGTTSNITLVSGGIYEIDIEVYFTKTTAEAVTWTFTNSVAPTSMNIHADMSPVTGVNTTTGGANLAVDIVNSVTAAQTIVTGVLTTAVNHYARFKIFLTNATGTSLKIQAACTTASGITPLRGSRWTARRIPAANTGVFAA